MLELQLGQECAMCGLSPAPHIDPDAGALVTQGSSVLLCGRSVGLKSRLQGWDEDLRVKYETPGWEDAWGA